MDKAQRQPDQGARPARPMRSGLAQSPSVLPPPPGLGCPLHPAWRQHEDLPQHVQSPTSSKHQSPHGLNCRLQAAGTRPTSPLLPMAPGPPAHGDSWSFTTGAQLQSAGDGRSPMVAGTLPRHSAPIRPSLLTAAEPYGISSTPQHLTGDAVMGTHPCGSRSWSQVRPASRVDPWALWAVGSDATTLTNSVNLPDVAKATISVLRQPATNTVFTVACSPRPEVGRAQAPVKCIVHDLADPHHGMSRSHMQEGTTSQEAEVRAPQRSLRPTGTHRVCPQPCSPGQTQAGPQFKSQHILKDRHHIKYLLHPVWLGLVRNQQQWDMGEFANERK